MDDTKFGKNQLPKSIAQFVGGAMGLIFTGIGVTVLIYLWGSAFDEFGAPPLFFRIFASFIALSFVLIGGATAIASLLGIKAMKKTTNSSQEDMGKEANLQKSGQNSTTSYTCTRCGAPLGHGVEVSPHGDVKCSFCNAWFNIHQS